MGFCRQALGVGFCGVGGVNNGVNVCLFFLHRFDEEEEDVFVPLSGWHISHFGRSNAAVCRQQGTSLYHSSNRTRKECVCATCVRLSQPKQVEASSQLCFVLTGDAVEGRCVCSSSRRRKHQQHLAQSQWTLCNSMCNTLSHTLGPACPCVLCQAERSAVPHSVSTLCSFVGVLWSVREQAVTHTVASQDTKTHT